MELKKIVVEQSSEMKSSIRGEEHLEGGLSESSHVGEVQSILKEVCLRAAM